MLLSLWAKDSRFAAGKKTLICRHVYQPPILLLLPVKVNFLHGYLLSILQTIFTSI